MLLKKKKNTLYWKMQNNKLDVSMTMNGNKLYNGLRICLNSYLCFVYVIPQKL